MESCWPKQMDAAHWPTACAPSCPADVLSADCAKAINAPSLTQNCYMLLSMEISEVGAGLSINACLCCRTAALTVVIAQVLGVLQWECICLAPYTIDEFDVHHNTHCSTHLRHRCSAAGKCLQI